jgi:hypothetical protein
MMQMRRGGLLVLSRGASFGVNNKSLGKISHKPSGQNVTTPLLGLLDFILINTEELSLS